MPSLLCPSPTILDQSFPRDDEQLSSIAVALGEIQKCLEDNKAELILTDTLKIFIEDFDWDRTGPFPLLSIIHNLLNQWYLQPTERIIVISTDDIQNFTPHPIPEGTIENGYVGLWADEVGKILIKHDRCCTNEQFFLGVACDRAFAGLDRGRYHNPSNSRVFPLVGPDDLENLEDAYEWQVPVNIRVARIPFNAVLRNCAVLGATRVEPPDRDSHYHIYFGRYRWQISCNDDPTPDDYLRELVANIGLPLHVIKFALLERELPPKVLKIQ